jgi:hypothetical protein
VLDDIYKNLQPTERICAKHHHQPTFVKIFPYSTTQVCCYPLLQRVNLISLIAKEVRIRAGSLTVTLTSAPHECTPQGLFVLPGTCFRTHPLLFGNDQLHVQRNYKMEEDTHGTPSPPPPLPQNINQVEPTSFEEGSLTGDDLAELDMDFASGELNLETFFADPHHHLADENHPSSSATPVSFDGNESTTFPGNVKPPPSPPPLPPAQPSQPSQSASPQDTSAPKFPPKKSSLRRKKRNKGRPRRPLCGYNIFFQRHAKEIQDSTPFKDLGRVMGERWKRLNDEERAVYEKEAEKDVIRFRKEMDLFEKKRKERLCPSTPSSASTVQYHNPPSPVLPRPTPTTSFATSLQPPPGWAAMPTAPSMAGPGQPPSTSFSPINFGPHPLPTTGLPVPGQFVGTPHPSMALPQGAEIKLPDHSGATQKYKVVYACYRMTQEEANDYMARFAAVAGGSQPLPPMYAQGASMDAAPHPPPSPSPASVPPGSPHVVRPTHGVSLQHPAMSPQVTRSSTVQPFASGQAPPPPFMTHSPHVMHSVVPQMTMVQSPHGQATSVYVQTTPGAAAPMGLAHAWPKKI